MTIILTCSVKVFQSKSRFVVAQSRDRPSAMASRIREAELSWVPYIVIFGEKEMKTGELSVRSREQGKDIKATANDLVARIKKEIEEYPSRPLTYPKLLSQRPGYKRI
jgi:threonyl-tRNA synthetase